MNVVTRPVRPWGAIFSAAAALSALVTMLFFASAAAGATAPLTGGTTSLTLKKGFQKKLAANDVKLRKAGSGKVSGKTVELGVSGGAVDSATGQGTISHAGGFKLKKGSKAVSLTQVTIDLDRKALDAKVGRSEMKFGYLVGVSVSRRGNEIEVLANSLKLTGKAARALNGKLGLDGVFKSGNAVSNSSSRVQVAPGQPAANPPANVVPTTPPAAASVVDVMTRNLYLGADLGPAIAAVTPAQFIDANGQILREVTHNDFPTRAKGLAEEILEQEPDLVGLQEVALWRTAPVNVLVTEPSATTVRYDYLQELMAELNSGGTEYEIVVVQNEFDLEAPGDEDGSDATGAPFGADINGRLTMRDVILKKANAGVETSNAKGANFKTLLPVPIQGKPVLIKRGWTSADVSVRGSRQFRFVNTHLEAFHPLIRAAQAAELVEPPSGPATGPLPVILLGDLNSDDDTVTGQDRQAYEILVAAGMRERSTNNPLSCCLGDSELGETDGGSVADFDHQVDHVMTNAPADVQLVGSAVTGLLPVRGFWDSDHAGLFSSLEIQP